ncbi:hypothetical protein OC835_005048 [Tilletia horrida]|nr:hypothetical protein OC835_005048 [Tilletia horrida]KAK0560755.1 hypothetical protein OC844_003570 [Tilletia horrida]
MYRLSFTTATLFLAAALLALTQLAHANIVVHSPVAATKAKGGDKLDVEWVDDGKNPTLKSYGAVNVYLCTGSSTVQYKLQTLKSDVKTSRTKGSWKIDPNAGPNSDKYFLRFEGTNMLAGGVPPMAFSARFTLSGMKGTWNATILNTNKGASDAPSSPGSGSSGFSVVPSASASSASSAKISAPSGTPTLSPASSAQTQKGAAPRRASAAGLASIATGASLLLAVFAAAGLAL